MSPTRDRVADAAIEVLGELGLRALTHRAVDGRAGVPTGTTSNHFRTRAALLAGIVARLVERDRLWQQRPGPRITDADGLADAAAAYLERATGPERTASAARYTLFLAADADLSPDLAAGRTAIESWITRTLRELGSADPETGARALVGCLDGLILRRLATGEHGDDAGALRTVARAAAR